MAITHQQLIAQWGADRIIYFPLDRFVDHIAVGPEAFPPDGAFPTDIPILFTVEVEQEAITLFSLLRVQVGTGPLTELIVIGGSPEDENVLFCLNPSSGQIMLLDPEAPAYELVNSSFAAFVEFLYRLDELIQSDPGGAARAHDAADLRRRLIQLDPAAFLDDQSWWSAAFAQLTAAA